MPDFPTILTDMNEKPIPDNLVDEIIERMSELDIEDSALVALKIHALRRDDEKLSTGLDNYALTPRQDKEDVSCEIDFDLLARLKSICDEDEVLYWGRVICHSALRGDERRVEAIQGLMRCRVAN